MINDLFDRQPWPHQIGAVEAAIDAIQNGKDTCITSPTGSGKTVIMTALLRWCRDNNKRAILYTNRIMLTEQTMRVLEGGSIDHGVIAASQPGSRATLRDVQIASVQTVYSRCISKQRDKLFEADVVLVDECHVIARGTHLEVLEAHRKQGATLLGFTATPLGVSHVYPNLFIAARNSSCRRCGALVPAVFKVPSELDCSKLKLSPSGEFNLQEIRKKVWNKHIIGHVYDGWRKHNPDARPAVGFAPGVPESQWFVDQYAKRGVRCAHIDGMDVYVDGDYYKSDREARQQIIEEWRGGDIKMIWNRFVLREGIDFPWMYHLVIACPIGSLQGYIQCAGRVLRRSPETPEHVVICDHGGNYYRHKYSPNSDIDWSVYYTLDPSMPTRSHHMAMTEKPELAPRRCPHCHTIVKRGRDCPPPPFGCGTRLPKWTRAVIQHNGKLVDCEKPPIKKRVPQERKNTWKLWERMYHRMKRAGKTMSQARGLFFYENWYWPPMDLPLMPISNGYMDWGRKIEDLQPHELISIQDHIQMREAEGRKPVV